jgi:membrane-associated phospholipid phosphatase
MTPGGHWLAITQLFLTQHNASFYESLKTYALTSLSLYEAFISCWEAKYHYIYVRPETVISAKLDKQWHPLLITPPFPSYTSGHSTVSAAAAEVLTGIFGDNQNFTDTTEKEYGLPVRSFTSFRQAAGEASMSRVYAGIHYRFDCEKGNEQGKKVGQFVLNKVKF